MLRGRLFLPCTVSLYDDDDDDDDDDVLKLCRLLSPVKKLAAILAAVSHDVDHPGVSQTFLTTTDNPLASLYTVCIEYTVQ